MTSTPETGTARLSGVFLWMLLVCVAAYSGIAFMQESLKWDALDCYLPWRFFVGESIQHGIFPLWNPFQHFGYPIHGDMRSVFYPEAWLVGLTTGYGVRVLSMLFIGYLSIAGTGIYLLSGHFTSEHRARLLAGSAYVLSGFFVGHGQEMFGIVAATWIPWVLHYFIRLQLHLRWPDLWKLAFFLFLLITGGYQALSMMLLYLLVLLFLAEVFRKRTDLGHLRRIFAMNVALAVIVVLSLTVLIVTFVQVSPHIQRFAGITLEDAHFMPFSPQCLISWILPFAVVTDTDFYGTDLSMANGHFGLLMLMGLLMALFSRRTVTSNVFLGFGTVCLLASFGSYTPVREWLFRFVPLMDLFRMSAFFYYFALLAFILMAAAGLGRFMERPTERLPGLLLAASVVLIVVMGVGLWFYVGEVVTYRPLVFLSEYRDMLGRTPRLHHVLIHAVVQSVLLIAFISGLVLLRKRAKALRVLLPLFLLAEMTAAVRLNFPITVGSGHSPERLQAILDSGPQGFPIPDPQTPVGSNRDNRPAMTPLWHNTNIFSRTVSAEGFNSFRIDAFERFREDDAEAFSHALQRPVVFLADDRNDGDTVVVQRFAPGHVAVSTNSSSPCEVVVQQMSYPGWHAFVDGEPVPLGQFDGVFLSVNVPDGMHRVEFHYRNPQVLAGFGLSYGMFAIICAMVVFFLLRDEAGLDQHKATAISVTFVAGVVVLLLCTFRRAPSDMELRHGGYARLAEELKRNPGVPALVQLDLPYVFDSLIQDEVTTEPPLMLSSAGPQGLRNVRQWLRDADAKGAEEVLFGAHDLAASPVLRELILQHFPKEEKVLSGRTRITRFAKGVRQPLFSAINDLEQPVAEWPHDPLLTDTVVFFSGNHSWRMDAAQPGSPAISFALGDKGAEGMRKAVVECRVRLSTSDAHAAIFLKLERDGKPLWEAAQGVRELATGVGEWYDVTMVAHPPMPLLPADRLQLFLWGGSEQPLHVDDLRLSLYAEP